MAELGAPFNTLQYFWSIGTLYILTTIILLLLTIYHTYNTISDLCTSSRSSLRHRAHKPKKDRKYIFITIITLICLFCYTMTSIIALLTRLQKVIANASTAVCLAFSISALCCYTIAKATMYLLFTARLYSVYGQSAYKYNPKLLLFLAILTILYCFTFCISFITSTTALTFDLSFADYAILCIPIYPKWIILSIAVYDFIISILFLFMFNYPLKAMGKREHERENKNETNGTGKKTLEMLMKMGIKSKVLIWTAVISTIIALGVAGFGLPMLISIDTVINCICICLMTPYYNDKIYYYKLCGCCIKCCSGGMELESESDESENVNCCLCTFGKKEFEDAVVNLELDEGRSQQIEEATSTGVGQEVSV